MVCNNRTMGANLTCGNLGCSGVSDQKLSLNDNLELMKIDARIGLSGLFKISNKDALEMAKKQKTLGQPISKELAKSLDISDSDFVKQWIEETGMMTEEMFEQNKWSQYFLLQAAKSSSEGFSGRIEDAMVENLKNSNENMEWMMDPVVTYYNETKSEKVKEEMSKIPMGAYELARIHKPTAKLRKVAVQRTNSGYFYLSKFEKKYSDDLKRILIRKPSFLNSLKTDGMVDAMNILYQDEDFMRQIIKKDPRNVYYFLEIGKSRMELDEIKERLQEK